MIKKYRVNRDCVFAKSMVLPFYEGDKFGFSLAGVDDRLRRELFPNKYLKVINKNGDVDPYSLPTYLYTVYLDEFLNLQALILYASREKKYYCFRADHNNDLKLRFQINYMGEDIAFLEKDCEKSFKRKGVNYYEGEGDSSLIKDIDFFAQKYSDYINPRINKKAGISQLIFTKNNKFTADFIHLAHRNIISITNREKLAEHVLSSEAMIKLQNNRRDALFINFNTGSIEYFIYTYRPYYVNHYLLFKNLGNNKFAFIAEDLSFNKLLLLEENKDFYFKVGSEFASNNLSKMDYDDFCERYQEFVNDEEADENFNSDLELLDILKSENDYQPFVLDDELKKLFDKYNARIEDNVLYFRDYEFFPLACFGPNYIKFKQNRLSTDFSLTNQISLKDLHKVETNLVSLLQHSPSSRLSALNNLIAEVIDDEYDDNDDSQQLVIQEIKDNFKTIWPTDKKYPNGYLSILRQKYLDWVNSVRPTRNKISQKKKKAIIDTEINITLHAGLRLEERLGIKDNSQQLKLAQEAYSFGHNSVHFYEQDKILFSFLQYQQNKYPGKTLRLYKDFIFIYSLRPPHDLVTCFPIKENFERYVKNMR